MVRGKRIVSITGNGYAHYNEGKGAAQKLGPAA